MPSWPRPRYQDCNLSRRFSSHHHASIRLTTTHRFVFTTTHRIVCFNHHQCLYFYGHIDSLLWDDHKTKLLSHMQDSWHKSGRNKDRTWSIEYTKECNVLWTYIVCRGAGVNNVTFIYTYVCIYVHVSLHLPLHAAGDWRNMDQCDSMSTLVRDASEIHVCEEGVCCMFTTARAKWHARTANVSVLLTSLHHVLWELLPPPA